MKKTFPLVPWLTFESIKKFYDPTQILGFIIPTTGFYYEIIPKFINLSNTELLAILLVIFVFLFSINLYNKYIQYEKSIAEVLETGYFFNFFDKTASHLWQKKQDKKPVHFKFNDGSIETVTTDKIKVKVILPLSLSSLENTIKNVEAITKLGNIDNSAWVLAKKNLDNTITIYEYPRTLTAIPKYLPIKSKYSEEQSKYFHKHFNFKFDQDWNIRGDRIPSDIFMKINEFEE